jgi:pyruvate/2-oxoglutarate dehydrogenase complex dihydrolipoamide acyltransferase (E2) component
METATIVRWLKKEGDRVEKGEPILEVMTEKVTMELQSTASGTLHRILVQEGEEAPVATVIAIIA